MVVVGIVGPPQCGKKTVSQMLCNKWGFRPFHIGPFEEKAPYFVQAISCTLNDNRESYQYKYDDNKNGNHQNDNSNTSETVDNENIDGVDRSHGYARKIRIFDKANDALNAITEHWREPIVITGIYNLAQVETLRHRPYFLLLGIDAPLKIRFERFCKLTTHISSKECMRQDATRKKNHSHANAEHIFENKNGNRNKKISDCTKTNEFNNDIHTNNDDDYKLNTYGSCFFSRESTLLFLQREDCYCYGPSIQGNGEIRKCLLSVDLHIFNDGTLDSLIQKIAQINILNDELVRPSWDTYFMRLTFLAASRSNCMKRRVGAIVVNNNRVVATGYNGTPSRSLNCNMGGCYRCNDTFIAQGRALEACECIHAEANALLEAGRSRCDGSSLYVTCTPCLGCAKLIAQAGIRRVIYANLYDPSSGALEFLKRNFVDARKFSDFHPGVPCSTVVRTIH